MSAADKAQVALAIATLIGLFIGSVRWLVKHFLMELKTNGGSSMRDEIKETRAEVKDTRAEIKEVNARVDTILRLLEK